MAESQHDVVVVGAGIAGLAAATALHDAGITDVVVLEAQERVGGRMLAVPAETTSGPFMLDLGASWIHGTKGNPVAALASKAGLRTNQTTEGLGKPVSLGAFDEEGPVPVEAVARAQQVHLECMAELDERIEAALEAEPSHSSTSSTRSDDEPRGSRGDKRLAADCSVAQELCASLQRHPLYSDLSPCERRVLGYFRARDEEYMACGFDQLSFLAFNEDEDFPGDQLAVENYASLTTLLAKPLDVRLNHEATRVVMNETTNDGGDDGAACQNTGSDGSRVIVHTRDGPVFAAKRVLIAVPVPLLQTASEQRLEFQPPLPASKQASIDAIGFGTLNKVALVFRSAWWDGASVPECVRDKEYLSYVPMFSDPGACEREGMALPVHYVNFHKMIGPPILTAMIYGKAGEAMEKLTDAEVSEKLVAQLQGMYGPYVADPCDFEVQQVFVTRWHANKFERGSYSTMRLGCSGDDYDAAGAAVSPQGCSDPTLFFAGEHTVREYFGTVHAAYLSGTRAASSILKSQT
eukprot:m.223424 g.223424  ORF g.223424 m.223424 type:complete len:521 (-) comp18753_c0_seq3:76-1638(-)